MVALRHAALHAQEQQIVWQQILMKLKNTFGRFQSQIRRFIKKRIQRNREIDASADPLLRLLRGCLRFRRRRFRRSCWLRGKQSSRLDQIEFRKAFF